MSKLFQELGDDEAPAFPLQIIPEAVESDPLTLYVKQISPSRLDALREKQNATVGGQRQDAASKARRKHAFLTEFLTEVLEPRWDNATEENLSILLRRAKGKLGDSVIEAIQKDSEQRKARGEKGPGQLEYSTETIVTLVKVTHDEDMDSPIWLAAKYGVEQEVKAKGEGASGSGSSA